MLVHRQVFGGHNVKIREDPYFHDIFHVLIAVEISVFHLFFSFCR